MLKKLINDDKKYITYNVHFLMRFRNKKPHKEKFMWCSKYLTLDY